MEIKRHQWLSWDRVGEEGRRGEEIDYKETRELFGVTEMFCVLTVVVVVTRLYTYVKAYITVHFK